MLILYKHKIKGTHVICQLLLHLAWLGITKLLNEIVKNSEKLRAYYAKNLNEALKHNSSII
jgi:hypothetical protein